MESSGFGPMWLTVNRRCNFRCKWCYAEETHLKPEDEMSLETARSLIDLASNLEVKSIIIVGGEPTLWKHLFDTIQYIHEKKLESILVTNGYLLSKDDFLAKIEASALNCINISLKAANREQHIEFTGRDSFQDVLNAIEKAGKLENKEVSISYVLSKLTVDNLREVPVILKKYGGKSLSLDMCSPVFHNRKVEKGYALTPVEFVKAIIDNADEMNEIMDKRFSVSQQTMGCIWPKETLERLINEGKVATGSCQMSAESGIIFTPSAELIPCNALFDYPMGKLGVEFNDAKSFLEYRNSPPVVKFFGKIKSYPLTDCIDCSEHTDCIGGCPLQWMVFDPDKIKNEYKTLNKS